MSDSHDWLRIFVEIRHQGVVMHHKTKLRAASSHKSCIPSCCQGSSTSMYPLGLTSLQGLDLLVESHSGLASCFITRPSAAPKPRLLPLGAAQEGHIHFGGPGPKYVHWTSHDGGGVTKSNFRTISPLLLVCHAAPTLVGTDEICPRLQGIDGRIRRKRNVDL
jgi:hypothetical protein